MSSTARGNHHAEVHWVALLRFGDGAAVGSTRSIGVSTAATTTFFSLGQRRVDLVIVFHHRHHERHVCFENWA